MNQNQKWEEMLNNALASEASVVFDDERREIVIPSGDNWAASYDSLDTPGKLIKCVYHLVQKAWMSKDSIAVLMEKCSAKFGYEIEPFDAD